MLVIVPQVEKGTGTVSAADVAPLLKKSNLPDAVLHKVREIVAGQFCRV